jgi:hypothetical protein
MNPNILPPDQNISEKQLHLGYWFVTHKLEIKKWFTFALMLLGAALWLFTIGMLVKLYLVDYTRDRATDRALAVSLVNPNAIAAAAPRPLVVNPVVTLVGNKGAIDATVTVTNPNDDFWVSWTGRFDGLSATSTSRQEFILPGETKQLLELGVEGGRRSGTARYVAGDPVWHRVDKHVIPDYKAYLAERFAFDVANVEYSSATSADGASVISRVTFDATNRSAYSYWTVKFLIDLYRGTSLAAVNSVELDQFETGETRQVEVVWVQDLAAISKVDVVSQVNVLDAKSFMSQKGAQ